MKSAGFEKAFFFVFFLFLFLFFYPFMISAENTEKCRFFMPQFFSLKHRRISASYKHAY